MTIGKWAASPRVRRIAFMALAIALAAAIIALFVTRQKLSAVEAQRAQLEAWQSDILAQLNRALPKSDAAGRMAPADASEALGQIIASRDGALFAVAPPHSSSLPSPDVLADRSDAAKTGGARASQGISQLLGRQSTGAAAEDASAIDNDSQTPWKGWQ